MNRSVYELFIHCNSGEVLVRSVFDPLNCEIHPATKLLNVAYIERHFPAIDYEAKTEILRNIHQATRGSQHFAGLPDRIRQDLHSGFDNWQPVSPGKIATTISKLSLLRKIENFYLRNFSITLVRDVIRMQFNCDGTQIVNAQGFLSFLEQNIDEDEVSAMPDEERRVSQRRATGEPAAAYRHGERRSPTGRRQEDWQHLIDTD